MGLRLVAGNGVCEKADIVYTIPTSPSKGKSIGYYRHASYAFSSRDTSVSLPRDFPTAVEHGIICLLYLGEELGQVGSVNHITNVRRHGAVLVH